MYIYFAGDNYYPGGGWNDFIKFVSSVEEARELFKTSNYTWGHVVEMGRGIVATF